MIGYYIACDLFELCDQEQLIYIFGCSQLLLESKNWLAENINEKKNTIQLDTKNYQLISLSKKNFFVTYSLYGASWGGHISLINLIIEKGNHDLNFGLFGACRSGNSHLVKSMIEKGANNWDWGIWYACKGGNISIVNLMIEKGATNWNWGLYSACFGSHPNLVKLMIEKGANECLWCNKTVEEHQ